MVTRLTEYNNCIERVPGFSSSVITIMDCDCGFAGLYQK